jgi:hypothetical protein
MLLRNSCLVFSHYHGRRKMFTRFYDAGEYTALSFSVSVAPIANKWMVNSEMNARWCYWRQGDGSTTLADSIGLWSVHIWKGLPSRQK